MARLGKGKPMSEQARSVLRQHTNFSSRHAAKLEQGIVGSGRTGQIHSIRTLNKYIEALTQAGQWAREQVGLRHLNQLTPAIAQRYLETRIAAGISQGQVDADRNAMEFVTGHNSLKRVRATAQPERSSRAYTAAQVERIAQTQSEANALATRIAYHAGLRAHELLTLRPAKEGKPSVHRVWSPARFRGRQGERYLVTGKGGLVREVLIPHDLARELETHRITPERVRDRGVIYTRCYHVGGGHAWSQSFSDCSQRELGWSTGAHGLRHSYAQERLRELQARGIPYLTTRSIVSQELGHFRADMVLTYLR
jgi:integrase